MSCCGNCGNCSGCARELELTKMEMDFLQLLGQVAFLPVGRKMGNLTPIDPEAGAERQEEASLLLQCLEKKGLISLDYDKPLKGFRSERYDACPLRGSMALTERGQKVLELLDVQGYL